MNSYLQDLLEQVPPNFLPRALLSNIRGKATLSQEGERRRVDSKKGEEGDSLPLGAEREKEGRELSPF